MNDIDLDKDYKFFIDVGNEINSYVWDVSGLELRNLLSRLSGEYRTDDRLVIANDNEVIMINKINRVHWREDKHKYNGK